jgi:hypothetical protein
MLNNAVVKIGGIGVKTHQSALIKILSMSLAGTKIAKLSPGATQSHKALPDKRFKIG